ncbi:hypothetical protein [Bradyrhizobium sp. RDI18]|uniref:hypothetical protein n=1 Tax=Bradyrhizobium sp. RDI18 TaxID=3367400 RepID=UPI0037238005
MKDGREIGRELVPALDSAARLAADRVHHKIRNFQSRFMHGLGHEIAFDGDRASVFLDPEIAERLLNQFVRGRRPRK